MVIGSSPTPRDGEGVKLDFGSQVTPESYFLFFYNYCRMIQAVVGKKAGKCKSLMCKKPQPNE